MPGTNAERWFILRDRLGVAVNEMLLLLVPWVLVSQSAIEKKL